MVYHSTEAILEFMLKCSKVKDDEFIKTSMDLYDSINQNLKAALKDKKVQFGSIALAFLIAMDTMLWTLEKETDDLLQ